MLAGTSLVAIMLNAPVAAIAVRGSDRVVHAVDMDGVHGFPGTRTERRTTCDAACGARVRLIGCTVDTGEGTTSSAVALFPPYVAPLRASGGERCRACWVATGRMRPRMTITWRDGDGE
jgi:hypothetical protein